jgi:hypothetical protein
MKGPRFASGAGHRRLAVTLALVAAGLTAFGASGEAQRRRGNRSGGFGFQARATQPPRSFDGQFNFCRVAFRGWRGSSWAVDYPWADQNFMTRVSELTKTPISRTPAGEPNHVIVQLADPELFDCPFVMMTEPGNIFLDDAEVAQLRAYTIKGGFLWADDFWGTREWYGFEEEIRKVFPSGSHRIVDLPLTHQIFNQVFHVRRVPQIPSINAWYGTGGTSERGSDSAVPHVRAIMDDRERIVVLITHNTDFGDSWERESEDPNYFREFSVDGYAFGINVLVYAMTH